jgi:DNA-binding Xre family transcriptional regulator
LTGTNQSLLDERIEQKNLKLKGVAKELGITPQALKLKRQSKAPFKANEIAKLCEILDINDFEEMSEIFFAVEVGTLPTGGKNGQTTDSERIERINRNQSEHNL